MKNEKGFTLIEILAVIVILGLLLLIAIPAVSNYIEQSRRDTYIDSARQYILAVADQIANGDFAIHDQNSTYYIDFSNIKIEKEGVDSPYGKWVNAYVVITIDEDNTYNYYWTSVDKSGHRVDLTKSEDLKRGSIYVTKDLKIPTNELLDDTCILVLYGPNNKRTSTNHCDEIIKDKEYTIVLNQQGVTNGTRTVKVKYGEQLPDITVPTKNGYTFMGYFLDVSGRKKQYYSNEGKGLTTFDKKEDLTLYAYWEPLKFTISYDANGGDHNPSSQTKKFGVDINLTYDVPKKANSRLLGWNTTRDGDGTFYKIGAKYTDNKDITLYAQWEDKVGYRLTYDNNGGTGCDSKTINVGESWGELCVPARAAYVFDGWYTDVNGGTKITASTVPTDDLNVFAHWTPIRYTITFASGGGTGTTASVQCTYGEECRLTKNNFVLNGYRFNGWDYNGKLYNDNTAVKNLTDQNNETLVFTATWLANNYKIIFNSNGGTGSTPSVNCTYGTSCQLTRNGFSKKGYTFGGWKYNNNYYGDGDVVQNLATTGNVTLTAQWIANTYTIEFNGNSNTGGQTSSVTCTYDKDCELTPNGFVKTGYTFNGWLNGSTPYVDRQIVRNLTSVSNGKVTMLATWRQSLAGTLTLTASWPKPSTTSQINVVVSGVTGSGTVLYQYSINGSVKQTWTTSNSYTYSGLLLHAGHTIKVETKSKESGYAGPTKEVTIYTPYNATATNTTTSTCGSTYKLAASGVYGAASLSLIGCDKNTVSCSTSAEVDGGCPSTMRCTKNGFTDSVKLDSSTFKSSRIAGDCDGCVKKEQKVCNDAGNSAGNLCGSACSSGGGTDCSTACARAGQEAYDMCSSGIESKCASECATINTYTCRYSGIVGTASYTGTYSGVVYPTQTKY